MSSSGLWSRTTNGKGVTRTVALVYVRKSLVRPASPAPASPELQESACRERAAALGLAVELHTDASGHLSGKTDARPAWRQVWARLAAPEVAALIVYSHDRAFRNLAGLLATADRCQSNGVQFVSIKDGVDIGTAQGRFVFSLLGSMGEFESNIASERRAASIDHLRRERGRHYGTAPFGTQRIRQGAELVLTPSTQPQPLGTDHQALTRLYELRAHEGLSLYAIADQLNREGWRWRTRGGKLRLWTPADARSCLLRHWIYAGYVIIGKVDRAEVEVVRGSHAPILPESLTSVAAGYAVARQTQPRRSSALYPLTGTIECTCGNGLVGSYDGDTRRYRHLMRCPALNKFSYAAEPLELEVRRHVAKLVIPPDLQAAIESGLADILAAGQGGGAERERARLAGALDRLQQLYVWGDLAEADYRSQRAALLADLAAVPAAPLPGEAALLGAPADAPPLVLQRTVRVLYERIVLEPGGLRYVARDWCAGWA